MFDFGSFMLGRKSSGYIVSPNGTAYRKKSALEFNGNQYIETQFKPTDKTKIEAEFNMSSAGNFLFGSRTSNTSSNAFALAIYESTSYPMFGSTQSVLRSAVSVGQQHKIVLGQNGYFVDRELKKEFDAMSFTSGLNLYLGALNQNGSTDSRMFNGVFYSVRIYEQDILKLNLQPCIRVSDGTVGMYDKVNNQFYELITAPISTQMTMKFNQLNEFEMPEVI